MKYELRLDPIRCTGEGMCAELFPEAIRLDDWGYPIIERRPLTRGEMSHARRTVAACPALALSLVKVPANVPVKKPVRVSVKDR